MDIRAFGLGRLRRNADVVAGGASLWGQRPILHIEPIFNLLVPGVRGVAE